MHPKCTETTDDHRWTAMSTPRTFTPLMVRASQLRQDLAPPARRPRAPARQQCGVAGPAQAHVHALKRACPGSRGGGGGWQLRKISSAGFPVKYLGKYLRAVSNLNHYWPRTRPRRQARRNRWLSGRDFYTSWCTYPPLAASRRLARAFATIVFVKFRQVHFCDSRVLPCTSHEHATAGGRGHYTLVPVTIGRHPASRAGHPRRRRPAESSRQAAETRP